MLKLKTENIPVVSMLLVLSWASLVLAVCVPGILLFSIPWQRSLWMAAAACGGAISASVLLRAFAKTCQMVFDIKRTGFELCSILRNSADVQQQVSAALGRVDAALDRLEKSYGRCQSAAQQQLQQISRQLDQSAATAEAVNSRLLDTQARVSQNLEQVNCDTRDLNRCVEQIRAFFEKIERHLGLGKG